MTISDEFADIFRDEHREVRDLLFSLINAFQGGDTARARTLVGAVAAATGPHVSDCDGLAIMVETLPSDEIVDILATRDAALEKNLDLLTWAGTVRTRRV